jgi:hypothetical protein
MYSAIFSNYSAALSRSIVSRNTSTSNVLLILLLSNILSVISTSYLATISILFGIYLAAIEQLFSNYLAAI